MRIPVDSVDDNVRIIYLLAYGVGEEMLNADAPTPLLSDIISNALPQQPMMKDGKMNNELNVSVHDYYEEQRELYGSLNHELDIISKRFQ